MIDPAANRSMGPAVIVAVGLCLLLTHLVGTAVFAKPDGRVVFGDATHHFVQLRSMVFDHDLQFGNEYTRIYGLQGGEPDTEWITRDLTPTGHVRNYMPVGPALLWAPLYVTISALLYVLHAFGWAARPDGYEHVLQLVPGVTGVLATAAAALAAWHTTRLHGTRTARLVGVLAVWLGSHALYYAVVSPSYSHAPSMLATSLFFLYWMRTRSEISAGRLAIWGVLSGIATLMRWQDVVLLVVPLIEVVRWPVPWRRRLAGSVLIGTGWLVAFLPQMIVWTVLYGRPLAVPQGPGFMQWTSPHLLAVLFSNSHGLYSWTPILLPATIGLVQFARRRPAEGIPMMAVVLATWYVNAAVADWWGGEAFGARRFLSLFPLFVLGTIVWLGGRSGTGVVRWRVATLAILVAANWLLLFQYQLFMKGYETVAPYPSGWPDLWLTRLLVPFRLLGW